VTLTVLFMPESAYGPTNQCIGLGKVLLDRGHTVVFAAERSWEGRLAPFGFVEALVDLAPPDPDPAPDAAAGQFWIDFINETAPEFRKPTIDQLATFIQPTYQALIDGAKYCEAQLAAIVADHRPDVLVEDNVIAFPALTTATGAFVRVVSCNPLEVRGPDVAPPFSGYPADDRSGWADYLAAFDRAHGELRADFDAWVRAQGAAPLPPGEFIHTSAHANLYVYPAELDYTDARPLDASWHRLDSSVRETDDEYALPAEFAARDADAALVYLSLGSLGSADIGLMRRLIDVLGATRHKVIVSLGPRADELTLPPNMVGAAMLPQTKIIPQVDLVITHGGNNTTTECMHFGKPMILLPLFWDQYDNAQRVHERGYGIRLSTYGFADDELPAAVDRLFADGELRARAAATGATIRGRDGLRRGADVIEKVGLAHAARQRHGAARPQGAAQRPDADG
jgi:MGT family glycosyltransferase